MNARILTAGQIDTMKDWLKHKRVELANLDSELGRMPNHKLGTTWHADRESMRDNCLKAINYYERCILYGVTD